MRYTWPVLIITAVLLLPAVAAADAGPFSDREQQLLDHLQGLDRKIDRDLRRAQMSARAGDSPAGGLAEQSEQLRRHLNRLEADVRGWDSPRRQALLERLPALRSAVGDLESAAVALGRDPGALEGALPRAVPPAGTPAKGAPANDDCDDAQAITDGSWIGDSSGAVNDGSASCGFSSFAPDVWFKYTPTVSGEVYVSTFGSAFDTVLSVHGSCPSAESREIRCNDNQSGLQSALSFPGEEGVEVLIRVAGFAGASGPFVLEIGPGGALSGKVHDASSGAPISGLVVSARPVDGILGYSVTTTDDGSYTNAALPPDTYRVQIGAESAWVREVFDDLPCVGACDPDIGTPIEVGNNRSVSGIDFALDFGGSISGTVLEGATGAPIVDALVEVWYGESDDPAIARSFTDAAGHYSIDGLAAGTFVVSAVSTEHLDELYDDQPCPGGPSDGCDSADGEVVEVALGVATAGIDFTLNRLGAITGTITDSLSGEPDSFADVRVVDSEGAFAGAGTADVDGRYRVGGLPAGSYFARTATFFDYANEIFDDLPCPGSCDPTTGTAIAVTDAVTGGIDFALDPLGAISGTVREIGGEPAQGVEVKAWNDRGEFQRQGFSDSLGNFLVMDLLPGNHFVTTESRVGLRHRYLDELYDDLPCFRGAPEGCDPTDGTPVTVTVGTTTPGIEFVLSDSGAISGTVTAEATGDPLSDIGVAVYDASGRRVAHTESAGGGYTVFGLAEGPYFVGASSAAWVGEVYDGVACENAGCVACEDPRCDPTTGTPVTVGFGMPVEGIDFTLLADGGIAGTVNGAGSGPLSDYRVELHDGSGLNISVITDADGGYRFSGLAAGTYFVRTGGFLFDSGGPRYRDEAYDDLPCPLGCDPTAGTAVVVAEEGVITGIDFELDRLGSISGSVTDATDGQPISFARIALYNESGEFVVSGDGDFDGSFTVEGAPVGNVFVTAWDFGYVREVYDDLPCGDSCDVTAGTPISVELGEAVTGIDFALDFPGSISGTVTNEATGRPVAGIEVEIWDRDGERVGRFDTDQTGAYLAEDLVPGSFFITARADPYFGELYPDLPCPYDSCDPTAGTPVAVSHGIETGGIDFVLTLAGVVSGVFTDAVTGEELGGDVTLWDAEGNVAQVSSGSERYAFVGIEPGTYYLTAGKFAYHGQLYDGLGCSAGPPAGCHPTTGTPVIVTDNSFRRIDFALAPRCEESGTALCLNDDRFRLEASWKDFELEVGEAEGVELTDDAGYFWFFDDTNIEIVVKVLDACNLPGFNKFWVFAGGLTNVEAELAVTDTVTRQVKTYQNPLGAPFQPIRDTGAFDTCDAGRSPGQSSVARAWVDFERQLAVLGAPVPATRKVKATCGGDSALCLLGDRFRVEARWRTAQGETGAAQPVPLTDATGYFWFFGADNVEVIVKVLDACGLEGFRNFWVFAAGLTDVEVTLTVTDTESGEVQEYFNPLGAAFQPVQDLRSFNTCP